MAGIFNLPNFLSLTRIVLIPVLFFGIVDFTPAFYIYLIVLFFFTVSLDFFDGFLARKLHQETELGKILDPVADKLLVVALIAAFILKSRFPLWLAVPIILRDLVILSASLVLYKKRHIIKPSIFVGKITFVLLSYLLLVYIIDLNPNFQLLILKRFFSILTAGFLLWSFLEYLRVYLALRGTRKITPETDDTPH